MKSALVIGCSSNVWEDVKRAQDLALFDAVYCVKSAGIYFPSQFKTWITLHPEAMDDYEAQRHKLNLPNGYEIVSPPPSEVGMHGAKGNISRRVSYRWPGMKSSASSGIYGAKVALEDSFDRVVLAGIPMTAEAGHFLPESRNVAGQSRGKTWNQYSQFEIGLHNSLPHLMGKVRSMSGYTMKLLGSPSAEWFRA